MDQIHCKYEYSEVLSRDTKSDNGRLAILLPGGCGTLGRYEEETVGRPNLRDAKAPALTQNELFFQNRHDQKRTGGTG